MKQNSSVVGLAFKADKQKKLHNFIQRCKFIAIFFSEKNEILIKFWLEPAAACFYSYCPSVCLSVLAAYIHDLPQLVTIRKQIKFYI